MKNKCHVPDNQYFAKIYKEDLPKVKEAYARSDCRTYTDC